MKNLLLVVAHPDDESFPMAGTAAKYIQAGWTVRVICATSGEAGMRGPYERTSEDLGTIRERELKKAAELIGVQSVIMLGYQDGTLDSRAPGEIEEKVFRYMTSFAPDITITFEPKGISNHSDHVKLSRAVTYAFQRYAKTIMRLSNPPRHPRDMWQIDFAQIVQNSAEPRLYYACMPESVGLYLQKQKTLPKESFGKPWSLIPDKFITTIIDVSRFAKIKEKALRMHKSQESDVNRFFSAKSQPLLRNEFFILRMQGTKEVYTGKNDRVSNRL